MCTPLGKTDRIIFEYNLSILFEHSFVEPGIASHWGTMSRFDSISTVKHVTKYASDFTKYC